MSLHPRITVQEEFDVPPSLLWEYLTQLTHLQEWFFSELKAFEAVRGFCASFPFHYNNKTFTRQWTVREVISRGKLCLGWQYKEYPGDSNAEFSLYSSPKGCILKLTATILIPFPAMEEFSRESMKIGWTDLIQLRLKTYVESH